VSWADQMAQHSETFRGVWHEEGASYFLFDGKWTNDPNIDFDGDLGQELAKMDKRIDDLYTDFASGAPGEISAILTRLSAANTQIRENYHEHLDGMDIYLEDWEGSASDNFREYLNQLKDALDRKQDCIDAAKGAMQAYHDLITAMRTNVLDLVEQTQTALEQEDARAERSKLAILSAVVGVGAALLALPSAGTSLALVAASAGVGSALVAGGAGYASVQVGGQSKGEIISSMVTEGDKIIKDANEAWSRVENALFQVTTYLTNVKGQNLADVRPDRPRLITDDKFDPDDFHPDGQSAEDRKNVRKDDLVAEPERDEDEKRDHYIQDPEGPEDRIRRSVRPAAY
jgi:uncharacterized protein YukE